MLLDFLKTIDAFIFVYILLSVDNKYILYVPFFFSVFNAKVPWFFTALKISTSSLNIIIDSEKLLSLIFISKYILSSSSPSKEKVYKLFLKNIGIRKGCSSFNSKVSFSLNIVIKSLVAYPPASLIII